MSTLSKKKPGRKPSRSILSKAQRQAKNNKAFQTEMKKVMAAALADKLHVVLVECYLNYKYAYYDKRPRLKLYGNYCYVCWLLPDFYFRTINKGVRVNLLHFLEFKEKGDLIFMILTGKKEVLLDATNTKNIECLRNIMLEPRYIEARKKLLI
jgi:hypothetical protein